MMNHHPRKTGGLLLSASLLLPLLLSACGELSLGSEARKSEIGGELSQVKVLNQSSNSGETLGGTVIPLRRGRFFSAPGVRTEAGQVCQARKMGATWPDGSLRYLQLDFPVDMAPDALQTITFISTDDPDPAFSFHPSFVPDLPIQFRVGSQTVTFPIGQLIEDGPLLRVYQSRVRVPFSMFWAELTVHAYANLPHARFMLAWGNSDPTVPDLHADPGEVEFGVPDVGTQIEFAQGKVLAQSQQGNLRLFRLHNGGPIADGQSQVLEGRFVFAGNSPPRPYAMAKGWVFTDAFGAYGQLVYQTAVDQAAFTSNRQLEEGSHDNHPWEKPMHGCRPSPSGTGSQPDFGTIQMRDDLLLVDPSRLQSITRSVYQEACRPTHFREIDVAPVTLARHPRLLTYSGRPKLGLPNPDLLGKSADFLTLQAKDPGGLLWQGHDPEHLSVNYLAGLALVTGNRWAIAECEHQAELWLSNYTVDTGTTNDNLGAARAIGRSFLAGCWLYLVTGRDDLKQAMIGRVMTLPNLYAQTRPAEVQNIPVLVPRFSSARGHYWPPWEEAIGASGIMAVYRLFGTPMAHSMATQAADNVSMLAFGKNGTEWRVGYQIPFIFSNNQTYSAMQDPGFASTQSAGPGITNWSLAALVISAENSPNGFIRGHATQILREIFQAHPAGTLDERLNWACVSPNLAAIAGIPTTADFSNWN